MTLRILLLFLVLIGLPRATAEAKPFVHPGAAHTSESIAHAREMVAAGKEPWKEAWETLSRSDRADLDWKPEPRALVERGPWNRPDIGSSEFSADSSAAYAHVICWGISGKEAHAEKAAEILDAWSGTLEKVANHDAALLIGMSGYRFVVAAELLKHTWDGWPGDKQEQFAGMLREVFYPVIKDFYPTANGNWDASMMQAMMAMGVFLDDRAMYDRARLYFLEGKGNGAIGNYFMASGQCQESGRDQAHTQMGLDFLANTCETAWIQGDDLYGALDNRLLAGFEYTAKYNLGHDVPYEPYRSYKGRYYYQDISDEARGRLRPMYEKILNHYHHRKDLDAPFTAAVVKRLRDGERIERYRRRTKRMERALDTLMYAAGPVPPPDADAVAARKKIVCFGDSITKRGYPEVLAKATGAEVINAGVAGHNSSQGLKRIKSDVLQKYPDLVVILFGTNDLRVDSERAHVPVPDLKRNLRAMVHRIRGHGSEVILCTPPPIKAEAFFERHTRDPYDKAGGLSELLDNYRKAVIEVAEDTGVPVVDLHRKLKATPEWAHPDGVHPSGKGSEIIARHVAAALPPEFTKPEEGDPPSR